MQCRSCLTKQVCTLYCIYINYSNSLTYCACFYVKTGTKMSYNHATCSLRTWRRHASCRPTDAQSLAAWGRMHDEVVRCWHVCFATATQLTVLLYFISRVLWSLLIPVIWLHHHLLRGVVSVRLKILLVGTCQLCGSWSVAGHNHRKVIGQDPICAD